MNNLEPNNDIRDFILSELIEYSECKQTNSTNPCNKNMVINSFYQLEIPGITWTELFEPSENDPNCITCIDFRSYNFNKINMFYDFYNWLSDHLINVRFYVDSNGYKHVEFDPYTFYYSLH